MSQSLLRWRLVPALARLFFPAPAALTRKPVRSVACLRPGKLGDMIVATPLFSALKKQCNVSRLAVLCSPANEPVIRYNPHIDSIRPLNFHSFGEVLKTITWLRKERFDALIDLTPGFSRTNFIISRYSGSGTLLAGIEKERAADRYHIHVGGRDTHLADRILDAGEALTGVRIARPRTFEIYTDTDDREAAAEFVREHKGRGPLVGINLSAGRSERQWAYGHFASLVDRLISAGPEGLTCALIAVDKQREWTGRLAEAHSACAAVPEFPFLTITELIGACSVLVSCDTALVHAAAARKVPVVGLYTAHAENFRRWGPYGVRSEVIQSSSDISVNSIEPETVLERTMRLIKNPSARQREPFP